MVHPPSSAPRGGESRVPPPSAPSAPPVVLMPRRLPGGVLATLDALPAEALPQFRYEGPAAGLRRAMRAALAERLPRPRWLANWLLDDVLGHAALLIGLTEAPSLLVSLRAMPGDVQGEAPLLAADAARCRLVTAYRGPGLDWLPPRAAAGLAEGETPPAALLRRLARGDVVILRGDGDRPGVAHRAASGAGTALLLTVDAAGPARSAAAVERRTGMLQ